MLKTWFKDPFSDGTAKPKRHQSMSKRHHLDPRAFTSAFQTGPECVFHHKSPQKTHSYIDLSCCRKEGMMDQVSIFPDSLLPSGFVWNLHGICTWRHVIGFCKKGNPLSFGSSLIREYFTSAFSSFGRCLLLLF